MKEENIQELMLLPDEVIYNAEKFGFKKYVKTLVRLIAGKEVKTPIKTKTIIFSTLFFNYQ